MNASTVSGSRERRTCCSWVSEGLCSLVLPGATASNKHAFSFSPSHLIHFLRFWVKLNKYRYKHLLTCTRLVVAAVNVCLPALQVLLVLNKVSLEVSPQDVGQ